MPEPTVIFQALWHVCSAYQLSKGLKVPKKSIDKKCAICGNPLSDALEKKPFLPFCSKRCKMIDLGQWLGEKYALDENRQAQPKKSRKNSDE